MKAKRMLSLMLAMGLILTTMLTGCGEKSDKQSTTPVEQGETKTEDPNAIKLDANQELTFQNNSDIQTMDPAMAGSVPNWGAQAPVYEGLTKLIAHEDGTVTVEPAVAESWTISEDGLVYTFKLRNDAKWSDGVQVTAKDFVYSWQRNFDPKVGAVYAWMAQGIVKNSDAVMKGEMPVTELGVKAPDDLTVEFTLEKPSPFFLNFAGFPTYKPVRQDLIEKYTKDGVCTYGSSAETTVGNGPFVVKAWEPNAKIVYEPNENYWDKKNVHLTKLTRQIIVETNAIAQSLSANEVDIAGLNDKDWNKVVEDTGKYDIQEMEDVNLENLMFNCKDPVLKNAKIRLAISLAFDRERFSTEVDDGKTVAAYSMVAAPTNVGNVNYREATGGQNEYIKELAKKYADPKALLLEGMKELNLGDDPSKLEIHYMTRGVGEYSKKAAEWLKQSIETTLGIKFVIDMTEWNIMYDLIDAGDYQICQGGWTADYNDPSNFLDNYHYEKGYYNAEKLFWEDEFAKEYAALIDKASAASGDQERADAFLAAEKILLEQAPVSPMNSGKIRTCVGKYVKGYVRNPFVYGDFVGVYIQGK